MSNLDWAALWARDARLRPATMTAEMYTAGLAFCAEDSGGLPAVVMLDSQTIAALARDAAVRWLAKNEYLPTIDHEGGNYSVAINLLDGEGMKWHGVWSTLDAALYAACEAALDARDEA